MHTVVAAALYCDGKVLLCHRAVTRRWYPDVWDFPGGHVEDGESKRSALTREVREELSVDLSSDDVAAEPHAELVEEGLHLSIWTITSWSGDPVNAAPDEHDLLGWFSLREAMALPLAHPHYPALLKRLAAAVTVA